MLQQPFASTLINTPDVAGATPLHNAVRHNSATLVTQLLAAKADVYAHNSGGRTVLAMAQGASFDSTFVASDEIVALLKAAAGHATLAAPEAAAEVSHQAFHNRNGVRRTSF